MDDDEMVMIIVGDDKNDPVTTEEVLQESKLEPDINAILKTAKAHGEYITFDEDVISEYLVPGIDTEVNLPKPTHKVKHEVPSPKTPVSYVAQLRKKMNNNEEQIILHLSEMMRQTKPPPPPAGIVTYVDGKLVCTYCDMASLTKAAASLHFQRKHGPRYLVCYACGANFKCTAGLYRHEMNCAGEDARIVLKARGRYLGRKGRLRPFLSLNKFEPHNRPSPDPHSNMSICKQCPAKFTHKESLMAHELMHQGLRPYRCDKCSNAYTSHLALKRHMEIHTDIVYICDTCGRAFKNKNTLTTHMNTHLPQRKYPCDRCERRFAQRNALQHHINRVHLNIPPPFACAACPKRFPRTTNLKEHMKAKHGLTLMTRKMFIKALPSMKDIELKQATVVFNDPDTTMTYAPLGTPMFGDNDIEEPEDAGLENIAEYEENEEILDDQTQKTKSTEINEEGEGNVNFDVEVKNIPSDGIVRTSLEDNVELEFVKIVEQGESFSNNITSGDMQIDNFTYCLDRDSSDNVTWDNVITM